MVSNTSAGTPNVSLKSKVNKSETAMIEVMGVRDGDIYLTSTLSLFMTITLSLLNVTAMDDWSNACDPVAALYLACVFITQHASLHAHSGVFVFLVITELHGRNSFYALKKKKNLKMMFTFCMQYMSKH